MSDLARCSRRPDTYSVTRVFGETIECSCPRDHGSGVGGVIQFSELLVVGCPCARRVDEWRLDVECVYANHGESGRFSPRVMQVMRDEDREECGEEEEVGDAGPIAVQKKAGYMKEKQDMAWNGDISVRTAAPGPADRDGYDVGTMGPSRAPRLRNGNVALQIVGATCFPMFPALAGDRVVTSCGLPWHLRSCRPARGRSCSERRQVLRVFSCLLVTEKAPRLAWTQGVPANQTKHIITPRSSAKCGHESWTALSANPLRLPASCLESSQ